MYNSKALPGRLGTLKGRAHQKIQKLSSDAFYCTPRPSCLPPPSAPPLPLQAAPDRSDHDILRDSFRFIRSEGEDAEAEAAGGSSWEVRLARRYYR